MLPHAPEIQGPTTQSVLGRYSPHRLHAQPRFGLKPLKIHDPIHMRLCVHGNPRGCNERLAPAVARRHRPIQTHGTRTPPRAPERQGSDTNGNKYFHAYTTQIGSETGLKATATIDVRHPRLLPRAPESQGSRKRCNKYLAPPWLGLKRVWNPSETSGPGSPPRLPLSHKESLHLCNARLYASSGKARTTICLKHSKFKTATTRPGNPRVEGEKDVARSTCTFQIGSDLHAPSRLGLR